MPATVTLSGIAGSNAGTEYEFSERAVCIVGRAADCKPQIPQDDEESMLVSRHHCLFEINPPDIRVRDFGSLNGTFVNGQKIGQRAEGMTPEEGARMQFPEYDLKHGDAVQLGDTTFQVCVFVPAVCAECDREIPEEQKAQCQRSAGVYQ